MSDTSATEYVRLLRHVNGLMQRLGSDLLRAMHENDQGWAHISNASGNAGPGHVRDLCEQGMLKHAESQTQLERIYQTLQDGLDGVADAIYQAPPKK